MANEKTTYSYSRLTTYQNCEMEYYLNYILKCDGESNIYAEVGTIVHEIMERLQLKEMTNEEALNEFDIRFGMVKFMGYDFKSAKIEQNYVDSVKHFLANFEQMHGIKFEIEKQIKYEINGHTLVGYVDLIIHNADGTVSIIDWKTSSMYSKKDIEEHSNQLLIYALAVEQSYGYKVRDVGWNMMKYAKIKGNRGRIKTELRANLTLFDESEQCIVTYPITEDNKNRCNQWICDTIAEIESKSIVDEWKANCSSSYFCNNLCDVKGHCAKSKKMRVDFWENN